MKRITLLCVLLIATLVGGASSVNANGNDSSKNHASYWETGPWEECRKFPGNDSTQVRFAAFGYDRYRLILKGGSKFDDGNGYRVIINPAKPNTWYDNPTSGTRTISHYIVCGRDISEEPPGGPPSDPPRRHTTNYGGRILGPCGDPYYTARIWNGRRSTRAVTIVLEVKQTGRILFKKTVRPGQSIKPQPRWLPGGRTLILRRGKDIIDRERTVSGTYSWRECRNG